MQQKVSRCAVRGQRIAAPSPSAAGEDLNGYRYWGSVLQAAERELEAATGNITLKAAAKRYMRAKAEVRRLEQALSPTE